MRKLFVFIGVATLISLALAYVATLQGRLSADLLGYHIETSLFVAVIGFTVFLVAAYIIVQALRALLQGPEAFRMYLRLRRKDKGFDAMTRGLVAVGAWDVKQAQRAARSAISYLGETPMTLLLQSQAAQLTGDRDKARQSFEAMLDNPQTRLLGLRGLFVEAQRAGDAPEAALYAAAAAEMKSDLPWASNALLITQGKTGAWDAALTTIRAQQRHQLIDKAEGKYLRSVAMTAKAREHLEHNRDEARVLALDAHYLDPTLTPAAVLAATLLAETGDFKLATKTLERAWKLAPHPLIAHSYTHLRGGDSGRDRLKRARQLLRLHPNHPESLIAFASAAAEARDFALARSTLKPLLNAPTQRICLMMAKFAEVEDDDVGEMRSWLDKAMRAPRDAQWMGDGQILAEWQPAAPISGELGGVRWKIPQDEPQSLVLLQEQLPKIPTAYLPGARRLPRINADNTSARTVVPLLTPAELAAKVSRQAPFVPDDPGTGSDEDDEKTTATSSFH